MGRQKAGQAPLVGGGRRGGEGREGRRKRRLESGLQEKLLGAMGVRAAGPVFQKDLSEEGAALAPVFFFFLSDSRPEGFRPQRRTNLHSPTCNY